MLFKLSLFKMFGFIINFYKNIKKYFRDISIHGLCTIFRSIYWPEMVFWIIIFMIAVYYFMGLIYENLISFYNQPVTKTIDTTAYPVSLVPFPAVTVCNFNTVFKSRSQSIVKLLLQNGIKEEDVTSFLSKLSVLRNPEPINVQPYEQIYKVLSQNGYNNNSAWMENLAQPCSRMLQFCSWMGKEINCNNIFTRSTADFGFCCSFNSNLHPLENKDYYTPAGPLFGLYLKFNIEEEDYVSPTFNVTGMLVLVHNKENYATTETTFYSVVEPGKQVSMKLTPEVYEADNNVKDLSLAARKCLFPDEGVKLPHHNYTFENCVHMCKTNAIIERCGCIPYYHMHSGGSRRSCTLLDVPCLLANFEYYTALHIKVNEHAHNKNELICDCIPTCGEITYRGTIEALYYKNRHGIIATNNSGARIYFARNWCKKYSVSESMTVESFIATVGGFFSLCMGGSIVSACELIFYLLKSLFVKAPVKNDSASKAKNYPQLYWSEMNTYQKRLNRNPVGNNKNVVIFNPYFRNNYIE